MNYLAHILLARQSDAAMIGAMLGDFVKANDVRNYPAEIAREITLHRNIDSYTDSHPLFRSSVQLFGEGRRRYAGIVLDVLYDHLLSQRWDNFCDIHRTEFIQRFYRALLAHQEMLPEKLRLIAPRIVQQHEGEQRDRSAQCQCQDQDHRHQPQHKFVAADDGRHGSLDR